ncbi:MAG: aminopeptidase [Eubacterium sp.]|jgi:aspartyl aminopeptidase
MERKNLWESYSKKELTSLNALSEDYKAFITKAKTERLCVSESVKLAEAKGFVDIEAAREAGKKLKAGSKFYAQHMNKTMVVGIVGKDPLENGLNILGAHIDSPRLDLKQNPLYESGDFALLDTHYYGGIKKYQWVTLPLALYGVIAKKDGTVVDVAVGDGPDDPVFCVTDILIHLGAKQMQKSASVAVEGEALDVLIGSIPKKFAKNAKADSDEDKEARKNAVKAAVMDILTEKYGIEEEDFLSAEIEVVPAGAARDLGFDRSMVIGYGQDDRVCAYTSLRAILDMKAPKRTSVCILTDKEEIGSVGATGAHSHFFEDTMAEMMDMTEGYSEMKYRRMLSNSCMLSSDVSAGFDPLYADVFEKKNSAYLGRGITFNKYTGSRGKSGSNDASAEYFAKVRRVMDDAKVGFQTAELGKVDEGGGGTIAYILANLGMNVVDSGVAVLCMHSPWEVTSKADIYEAYKCYMAFCEGMTK